MKPLTQGLLGLSLLALLGGAATFAIRTGRASAAQTAQTGTDDKPSPVAANSMHSNAPPPPAAGPESVPCNGAPADEAAEIPPGLKVTVRATPKGPAVRLSHHGHVVAIREGGERRIAMNEVEWPASSGRKAVWETTDAKTLATVRGALSWDETAPAPVLSAAVTPAVLDSQDASSHACRAMGDGASGFVVVCRVEGRGGATSVETKDPKEGVWTFLDAKTLVRFDLPMISDGVDTKVIGVERAGKGTLVRVEASRVAGERQALLALAADGRSQPQPVRFFCSCGL